MRVVRDSTLRAEARSRATPECVGDVRVFYDVNVEQGEVLAIVAKAQAQQWLDRAGEKP